MRILEARIATYMFFIITMFIMLLFQLSVSVYAHSSIYAPLLAMLYPSQPSYVLLDPGSLNTTVSLGPSLASANVTITASNYTQLVKNPQFYSNPDYWYCSPGNYLSCYWLASDTGAVGGVVSIYGTIPALSYDSALIYQEVSVPNAPIESAYIYVTIRYATDSVYLTYWFAGIYDPATGNIYVAYNYTNPSTYTTYLVNLTGYVQPGKTYYVIVGVEGLTLLNSGSIDFRIDSAYFIVTTPYYVFSNTVLGVNATTSLSPPVYSRLILSSASIEPGLNATISLVNVSSVKSTAITITNGVVETQATSWIELAPTISGYSSGYIYVNVSKLSQVNSTLLLYLEICSGSSPGMGACTYYPVQLVIDPRSAALVKQQVAKILEPVPVSSKIDIGARIIHGGYIAISSRYNRA